MSLYTCSISGQPIKHPVVSKISGHIYEQELIMKHIEATGVCPNTNVEMTKDDLIELKGTG